MELSILQKELNANNFTERFIVFCESKKNDRFISTQYINKIAAILNKPIWYVDSLEDFYGNSYYITEDYLFVHNAEECNIEIPLNRYKNLIICCEKCTVEEEDAGFVIKVPDLKSVDILEYIESKLSCSEAVATELMSGIGNNPYCIDNEIDKILLFNRNSVEIGVRKVVGDLFFGRASSKLYDAVNAVITRNIEAFKKNYSIFTSNGFNWFGFLAMLHNGFINVAKIQLAKAPTPESTGLSSSQFYAVKRNINHYSKEELLTAIKKICSVDRAIKSGDIKQEDAINKLIVELLCS